MPMQTLEWHKESLKNLRSHCAREVRAFERQAVAVDICKDRIRVLTEQIARAEKEGKRGFDVERYNVKRP